MRLFPGRDYNSYMNEHPSRLQRQKYRSQSNARCAQGSYHHSATYDRTCAASSSAIFCAAVSKTRCANATSTTTTTRMKLMHMASAAIGSAPIFGPAGLRPSHARGTPNAGAQFRFDISSLQSESVCRHAPCDVVEPQHEHILSFYNLLFDLPSMAPPAVRGLTVYLGTHSQTDCGNSKAAGPRSSCTPWHEAAASSS